MTMEDAGERTWAPRPRTLSWLPAFLFRRDGGKLAYIVKAWLLAVVPSLVLALLVETLLKGIGSTQTGPDIAGGMPLPLLIPALVLIGPFLETLIMGGLLIVLVRSVGAGKAVLVSAVLWAIAHSLASTPWGLVVWWPFLILSIVFLTWRTRGFWLAVGMATAVHGLQNSVPAVLLLLDPIA